MLFLKKWNVSTDFSEHPFSACLVAFGGRTHKYDEAAGAFFGFVIANECCPQASSV
jgi:hypothetical protein